MTCDRRSIYLGGCFNPRGVYYIDMDLVTGYGDSDSEGDHNGTCSIEECEGNSNKNSISSNNNNSLIHKQKVLNRNSTVTVADPHLSSIASTSLITTSSVNRSISTISAPTSSSVQSVSASSTVTVDKKRKKFDISILPIEIQHALARGDTLKDSDDDDDEVTKVIETSTLSREVKKKHSDQSSSSSSSSRSRSSSSSCPLLSLLPNPKIKNNVEVGKVDLKSTSSLPSQPVKGPIVHRDGTYLYGNDDDDDDDDDKYKVKRSGITSDISTTTKQSSKSTFSFGYITTEETRIDKNGTSSVSNSLDSSDQKDLLLLHHDDDDDDVDHDNTSDWSMKRVKGSKSGVNPWFHADSKRSTAEVEYYSMMMISYAT